METPDQYPQFVIFQEWVSGLLIEREILRRIAEAARAYLAAQTDPETGDPSAETEREKLLAVLR